MHLKEYRKSLQDGASDLDIKLSAQQEEKLMAYLVLLDKWNKAYNLTAVRNMADMVSRHLLDSLSVVPYIEAENWLDVGSGGGMPGIPLAIMYPNKKFTLLDSNGKKTRFLLQAKLQLELTNITVINERAENFAVETPFSGIISRAFSELSNFIDLTKHLANAETKWFAMKGVFPEEELNKLPEGYALQQSYQLSVPHCEGQRHLLIISGKKVEHG